MAILRAGIKKAPGDSLGESWTSGAECPGWGEPGDFPYQGRKGRKNLLLIG